MSSTTPIGREHGTVEELTEADWDRSMNVMLKAIFLFGKYAFPAMRQTGGGAMVNIASVHGFAAARGYGVYAAAKAAVINLTHGRWRSTMARTTSASMPSVPAG